MALTGTYEYYCLLGCDAVQSGISLPTFWMNTPPPSSGRIVILYLLWRQVQFVPPKCWRCTRLYGFTSQRTIILIWIWSSHSYGYEVFYLLGYNASVLEEHWLAFTWLHNIISQKTELFTIIALRTSNLTDVQQLNLTFQSNTYDK
jgi:hypothetical protein